MKVIRLVIALLFIFLIVPELMAANFKAVDKALQRKEYKKAFNLLKTLAEKGDAEAQYRLALMYQQGFGVKKNDAAAEKWLREAAHNGHDQAIAALTPKRTPPPHNPSESISKAAKTTKETLAKLWRQLETASLDASGQATAARIGDVFVKQANEGDAFAQCKLAFMYANGLGLEKDSREAFKWSKKAAEQGEPACQCLLASMYERAEGTFIMRPGEALKWYQKAAEQGDWLAQFELAQRCHYGQNGLRKNCEQALFWYRKAAEEQYPEAQFFLGSMYANGDCVTLDYTEASRWYLKAAENGHDMAQLNLAVLYYSGNGVNKDLIQAYKWYRIASAHQANYRLDLAEKLSREMTPAEINKAKQLAQGWKKRPTAQTRRN